MDVSVIIVNWNTRRLLLECIESIVAGTLDHTVEVIVVDNASHDGSADAVEQAFPGCRVIRNAGNKGFAAANNQGIAVSTGRYVCLVNSDVKILEGCLDAMCTFMDRYPDVGVVGPQVLNEDLSIQGSCAELPTLRNALMQALFCDNLFPNVALCRSRFLKGFDYCATAEVAVLSGCFLMVRRTALEKVGALDEGFFIYREDVDWCKRFGDAGWQIVFYPGAQAIHYGGASSATAPVRFLIEMEKATSRYWRKHHSWLTAKTARVIGIIHCGLRLLGWIVTYVCGYSNRPKARDMIGKYAMCLLWLGGLGGYSRELSRQ